MGEWDASSTSESDAHQDYSVTSVLIHPDFYPPGVFYDLALLALNVDADTTKPNIGVACLPSLGTASQSGIYIIKVTSLLIYYGRLMN